MVRWCVALLIRGFGGALLRCIEGSMVHSVCWFGLVAGVFVRSVLASLACSFIQWCIRLMVRSFVGFIIWVHWFVDLMVRWFVCSFV